METMIKLTDNLITKIFCDLDSDRKKELQTLVKEGSVVLNPLNGEVVRNNTKTGIVTDYFESAFFIEEDEPSQDNDEKLIIASRMTRSVADPCQYICISEGLNGSHARAWDPNSQECYGVTCPIYPLRIKTGEGTLEFPIWFENREDATI